jgi:hypothetical protein
MRGVIKGVLKEELQNSLQMKKGYERALRELPQGCLARRKIRGHEYYYLVKREGNKVSYKYLGKISEAEKGRYQEAKRLRAKYRTLLARVKKQIRFLKGALRGKEPI